MTKKAKTQTKNKSKNTYVGEWELVEVRELPQPMTAVFGGTHSATILSFEQEIVERRLVGGVYEIRTRREPVFSIDARQLQNMQPVAAACGILFDLLAKAVHNEMERRCGTS